MGNIRPASLAAACRGLRPVAALLVCAGIVTGVVTAASAVVQPPAAADAQAVLSDPQFFPIAVWLQNPTRAPQYRALGINVYVGLWKGPTEPQLAELKKHGMRVVCSQNDVGLKHKDDATILGWMHGDEPDNAQSLGAGKGYGPPIPPQKIVEDYRRIKRADPGRPVLLNLGQGVAWDRWHGRGVRTNHPEDYLEYVRGGDIVSFDIYPACHDDPQVAGNLWFVADGVRRLREWAKDGQAVWNCIECTRISNVNAKATPRQVKAEVWMSLVRGSRGIIYFVHQFKPSFIEAGLLADAEMSEQVGALNRQIHELAPVLHSPTVAGGVRIEASSAEVPVEAMVKRHGGATYVFAVAMRAGTTTARFQLAGVPDGATAEVLGEGRTLEVRDGRFRDTFRPWDVHLYRIRGAGESALRQAQGCLPVLTSAEAWERLPRSEGPAVGRPLPLWARTLAGPLPRTTAAMLRLDYLQRTGSPLPPQLRGKMRWVTADANRCASGRAYAEADLRRSGLDDAAIRQLAGDWSGMPATEQAALAFARNLTLAADRIPDEEIADLMKWYGDKQVVAMVLLVAYANFQDRLLLALDLPVESGGPLDPLDVRFVATNGVTAPGRRPPEKPPADVVPSRVDDVEWQSVDIARLRQGLENQQARRSRIAVPDWDAIRPALPDPYRQRRHLRVQWSLICLGYQPELAAAWFDCLRTFAGDSRQDRVFEESLFWVITRTIRCFY
jgi:alkylhydroperoxidase family enzyme